VQARARLCDARIQCRLPAEAIQAIVDPGQVRQVLLNLLLNSLDAVASAPGPRSVQVGVEKGEHGIKTNGERHRLWFAGRPWELGSLRRL